MLKLNVLELEKSEYTGGKSSLCPGCGHDQISNNIIQAAWENGIQPEKIAKMSGIGCSSKTPAYFLGKSHGFNTVHGRMPSVTTGANLVNKDLSFLAVSGDGDTASVHTARSLGRAAVAEAVARAKADLWPSQASKREKHLLRKITSLERRGESGTPFRKRVGTSFGVGEAHEVRDDGVGVARLVDSRWGRYDEELEKKHADSTDRRER